MAAGEEGGSGSPYLLQVAEREEEDSLLKMRNELCLWWPKVVFIPLIYPCIETYQGLNKEPVEEPEGDLDEELQQMMVDGPRPQLGLSDTISRVRANLDRNRATTTDIAAVVARLQTETMDQKLDRVELVVTEVELQQERPFIQEKVEVKLDEVDKPIPNLDTRHRGLGGALLATSTTGGGKGRGKRSRRNSRRTSPSARGSVSN